MFCDLTMPGEKNGFDVAREIRANPALKNTWLIAVTGYDTPETHARAKEAGFDRIVLAIENLGDILTGKLPADARTGADRVNAELDRVAGRRISVGVDYDLPDGGGDGDGGTRGRGRRAQIVHVSDRWRGRPGWRRWSRSVR